LWVIDPGPENPRWKRCAQNTEARAELPDLDGLLLTHIHLDHPERPARWYAKTRTFKSTDEIGSPH